MLGQWAAFSVGFGVTFVACYVGPAILMLWLGLGLRRLNPVVRIPASILAGIGLIVFPIGTLISAYFLWLLLSPNGRTVFSADYRQVVAQTPHIKYRIPWWAWVMLSVVKWCRGPRRVAGDIVWTAACQSAGRPSA